MITLYKYLHESLLDDFDDIEKKSDDYVVSQLTKSIEFKKSFGEGWELSNGVLTTPNYTGVKYKFFSKMRLSKPLSEYLGNTNINILNVNTGTFAIETYNFELSSKTVANKIISNSYGMILNPGTGNINNIDIESNVKNDRIVIGSRVHDIKMKNVNINFNNGGYISINNEYFPEFNNVKSNTDMLVIHDTFMFDRNEIIERINKILDLPYTVKVKDKNKNSQIVEIPIKTFKKIHSIANNNRRYYPLEPLIRIKKGASISDLIDISGFKDLNKISIYNNLVRMMFYKEKPLGNSNYDFIIGNWFGTICKN